MKTKIIIFALIFSLIGIVDVDMQPADQSGITIVPTTPIDKCICSECEQVEQNNHSSWLCDSCLCLYYINSTDSWEFIEADICITKTIKWSTYGWILAIDNKCTNIIEFRTCNITTIEDITIVSCSLNNAL